MFMKKMTFWCLAAGCLMLTSQGWSSEKDREICCEDEEKAEQSKSQLCSEEDECSCKEKEEKDGQDNFLDEPPSDVSEGFDFGDESFFDTFTPEEEMAMIKEKERQRKIMEINHLTYWSKSGRSSRTDFIGPNNRGDGNTFATSVLNMLSATSTYGNFANSIIGNDPEKARMNVRRLRKGLGLQEKGAGFYDEFLQTLLNKGRIDGNLCQVLDGKNTIRPLDALFGLIEANKGNFVDDDFSSLKKVFFIKGEWDVNDVSFLLGGPDYRVNVPSQQYSFSYELTSAILFNPQAATYEGRTVGQYVSLVRNKNGDWFIVDSNNRVSPAKWENDKLKVAFSKRGAPVGKWVDYKVVMACYERK